MFDPRKLRQAKTEDIQKILFSAPKKAWAVPEGPMEGVTFEIHSSFELDKLSSAFPNEFRDIRDAMPKRLERWARVHSAGGFTRTDDMPGGKAAEAAPFALESVELGAVYVDVVDKSYIHFSSNQLPQTGLPISLKKVDLKWEVTKGKDTLTFSVRGALSLDVVIEYSTDDKLSSKIAAMILSASLPGLDELVELGLPLKEIKAAGAPKTLETWLVNGKGQRVARLAGHSISGIKTGPIDRVLFRIPKGFHNLRNGKPKSEGVWYPLGTPHQRRHGKPAKGRKASAEQATQMRAAYSASNYSMIPVGQVVPPQISTEPAFAECLPSTTHASSALEIRQSLLDAIQDLINLIAGRLGTVTGTRVDPEDPENTVVDLTIDWLARLEQFHQNRGEAGDALFCLLRDPVGGTGLLDTLADTLARQFVAADDPIPLGGEDDPVVLEQAIENEIAALAANVSIPAAARYGGLSAASRAIVREAVLNQRLATINLPIDGDLLDLEWPSEDFDLVHITLQLEQLAIEFRASGMLNNTIQRLLITVPDSNRPRIEFELALEQLDATLTMERSPGLAFWLTAAGVLVALAIVTPVAVAVVIMTLIGMGPLGLIVLGLLLSGAPVATVLGGALILSAVTYLVWDVTQVRVSMEQPILQSNISVDRGSEPEEVVLDPDQVSLDGEITVSVNSEIPSGIHQIWDFVVNFALTIFNDQVVEAIEERTTNSLEEVIRGLPHFRLPQPFAAEVPVEVTGALVDHIDVNAPRHRLVSMAANGVPERLLSAGALTRMEFPFPAFAPHLTQVDPDLREKLTARMEQVRQNGGNPRLGYAISQNLLNGIVFSQWLAGRFVFHYNNAQINEAFFTLIEACPECADISDREVHVWAAASPLVFVTERAYLEQEPNKPYLSVFFPDVRVCISGMKGKFSTLEIRFSIETIAHVAFGGVGMDNMRTFFSLERDFLNVLFDDTSQFLQLSPVSTQGLEVNGPGFHSIAAMDDTQRVELLQATEPLLEAAAVRLLRRNNVNQIAFLRDAATNANRFNMQFYDSMVLADIRPRRASLFVVIATHGPITQVIPTRDENDQLINPVVDLVNMSCEEWEELGVDFEA